MVGHEYNIDEPIYIPPEPPRRELKKPNLIYFSQAHNQWCCSLRDVGNTVLLSDTPARIVMALKKFSLLPENCVIDRHPTIKRCFRISSKKISPEIISPEP